VRDRLVPRDGDVPHEPRHRLDQHRTIRGGGRAHDSITGATTTP
jgi:hypothetical protein